MEAKSRVLPVTVYAELTLLGKGSGSEEAEGHAAHKI